VHFVDCVDDIT